jgi:hypothetical protein
MPMLKTKYKRRPANPTPLLPRRNRGSPKGFLKYHDTTALTFPEWRRRLVADEQFSKFIEVIKQLYVNIPLLDTMQVPTYAKYIKGILGNKKILPTTKVVQLTESVA